MTRGVIFSPSLWVDLRRRTYKWGQHQSCHMYDLLHLTWGFDDLLRVVSMTGGPGPHLSFSGRQGQINKWESKVGQKIKFALHNPLTLPFVVSISLTLSASSSLGSVAKSLSLFCWIQKVIPHSLPLSPRVYLLLLVGSDLFSVCGCGLVHAAAGPYSLKFVSKLGRIGDLD